MEKALTKFLNKCLYIRNEDGEDEENPLPIMTEESNVLVATVRHEQRRNMLIHPDGGDAFRRINTEVEGVDDSKAELLPASKLRGKSNTIRPDIGNFLDVEKRRDSTPGNPYMTSEGNQDVIQIELTSEMESVGNTTYYNVEEDEKD